MRPSSRTCSCTRLIRVPDLYLITSLFSWRPKADPGFRMLRSEISAETKSTIEVQEVNASMNEQTSSAGTLKRWEMADLQFLEDSKGNPCEFCRNSLFSFLETSRCWSWICEDYHHVQVQYRLSGCTYSLVLLLF